TANGLAADLQRHLANEPVLARPPIPFYRFRKTVSRNKLAFPAMTCVLAALVLGAALASWQAVRATRAEHAVRRNAYAAQISSAFNALAANELAQARAL